MRHCVICDKELDGKQRKFCSNRCKQQDKYEVKCGRRCRVCSAEIKKPIPVMGGFKQTCSRKACNEQ